MRDRSQDIAKDLETKKNNLIEIAKIRIAAIPLVGLKASINSVQRSLNALQKLAEECAETQKEEIVKWINDLQYVVRVLSDQKGFTRIVKSLIERKNSQPGLDTRVATGNLIPNIYIDYALLNNSQFFNKLNFKGLLALAARHGSEKKIIGKIVNRISESTESTSTKHAVLARLNKIVNPSGVKELPVPVNAWYLRKQLDKYITKRKKDTRGEYYGYWFKIGPGMGFSKETKLRAARALLTILKKKPIALEDWQNIPEKERKALKQGELGKIFKEFEELMQFDEKALKKTAQIKARPSS